MMDSERILTVQEALKRPLFERSQVVAGERGLHRRIRWVHILEITNFEKLIHGDEMILTTGVGLNQNADASSSVTFMDNLIRQNAACLCIEIGPYFNSVSEELIHLANRHDFPLIVFPQTVRFVDITQDLHSHIINRHHETLQELESLSREFHRLTLSSQGTAGVLKLLHKSTKMQVAYQPFPGKPICYPPLRPAELEPLLQWINRRFGEPNAHTPDASPISREYQGKSVVAKPVGAFDQTWAWLLLVGDRKPGEFEYLLLDSASLSIAQELLRTRYMEERKLFTENMWVDELLNGSLEDEKHLEARIGSEFKRMNDWTCRVILFELGSLYEGKPGTPDPDWESARLHLSLLLRSTFEKHSLRPLITVKNNRLAVIALGVQGKTPSKARLKQALEALQNMQPGDKSKSLKLLIGVGQCYYHPKDAHASYQEALQALSLYPCCRKPLLFYDELGVYQLLLGANDGNTLQTFVRHYLGPLIDHDRAKSSELLLTLKVFLDHDGSKQIAAQKLFIVRQSLYYRLDKITELLGKDFMSPDQRINLQVALRAYQMLHPESFVEQVKKQVHGSDLNSF